MLNNAIIENVAISVTKLDPVSEERGRRMRGNKREEGCERGGNYREKGRDKRKGGIKDREREESVGGERGE